MSARRILSLLFVVAVISCLAAPRACATVLVYKGSARAALPSTLSQFGPLPRVYVVFDLATQETFYLYYFTIKGTKGSLFFPPLKTTHYVSQALSATRSFGCFSFALDNSSGSDVGVNIFYLRGIERPLTLTSGPSPTTGNYPKTMAGIFREAQRFNSLGSVFELNLTLTFDAVHTQIGNNAAQSGQTVATAIAGELQQMKF